MTASTGRRAALAIAVVTGLALAATGCATTKADPDATLTVDYVSGSDSVHHRTTVTIDSVRCDVDRVTSTWTAAQHDDDDEPVLSVTKGPVSTVTKVRISDGLWFTSGAAPTLKGHRLRYADTQGSVAVDGGLAGSGTATGTISCG